MDIPKGEESDKGTKSMFKDTMAENFQNQKKLYI